MVSFQQKARRRILSYFGLLIALAIGMVIQRGFLSKAATDNNLQEVNLGEIDFGGSSARFMLVSLRGPLITGLWWEAVERQKKHEWNQLELLISTLTKLQPHFRKPWIFQAWNVAYNVSVEFDRVIDKYFYIAEGVQWLVEGERKNRALVKDREGDRTIVRGDPNMRWEIGHMIQNKMTVSDEKKTHGCLLQLSCIKPENRDPAKLRQDPQLLAEFKRTYPRLVGRIRTLKRVPEGVESQLDQELLSFLEQYRRIPFHDPSQLPREEATTAGKPATAFPVWPETTKPGNPEVEEFQDACEIARHWYVFSQEPLPPPNPIPGPVEAAARLKPWQRIPEGMSIFIFRAKPPQAKSWQAIELGKEGLHAQSQKAWLEAYEGWMTYGRDNGLVLSPEQTAELEKKARVYRQKYPEHATKGLAPTAAMMEEPEIRESMEAAEQLSWRDRNRSLGNFDHWEIRTEIEKGDTAVNARRHFHNAANRWRSDLLLARKEYEEGLDLWRKISIREVNPANPAFLLDLGSVGGFPVGALVQPPRLYVLTPFGADKQMQEEIVELQDEYQWLRAKCDAPLHLYARMALWRFARQLEALSVSGVIQAPAPLSLLPPLQSLESIEIRLAQLPGPLDFYLDQSIRKQLETRRIVERPAEQQPPPKDGEQPQPQQPQPPLPPRPLPKK